MRMQEKKYEESEEMENEDLEEEYEDEEVMEYDQLEEDY